MYCKSVLSSPSQHILILNSGNSGGETRVGGGNENMKAHIRRSPNPTNHKAAIFCEESKQADGSGDSANYSKLHVVEEEFVPFDEERVYRFHRALLQATLS